VSQPLICAHASVTAGVDYDKLADAIRQVETGRNVRQGSHGELGPWQFTQAAWYEDSHNMDFAWAEDSDVARIVAITRLKRMAYLLRERHLEANAYTLALCWNEGPTAVILGKFTNQSVRSYGERVRAIYTDPHFSTKRP
jgi:hypothetical protein